jgi:hypothetical protein
MTQCVIKYDIVDSYEMGRYFLTLIVQGKLYKVSYTLCHEIKSKVKYFIL